MFLIDIPCCVALLSVITYQYSCLGPCLDHNIHAGPGLMCNYASSLLISGVTDLCQLAQPAGWWTASMLIVLQDCVDLQLPVSGMWIKP